MPVYVVLLRGVNVGGIKVPMAELRQVAESCGFTDPRTYIQSGNLVFASPRRGVDEIAAELRHGLEQAVGHDIPMITRTKAQLGAAIAANPFIAAGLDPQHQSVSFFADDVPKDLFADVDLDQFAPEEIKIHKREVYFNLPKGTGHSPMLKKVGRRKELAVGTMRNWRTVTTLLELAGQIG
jgi:uncharacterized protein (DUF1697 family)